MAEIPDPNDGGFTAEDEVEVAPDSMDDYDEDDDEEWPDEEDDEDDGVP